MIMKVNESHKNFMEDTTRFLVSYGGAGSGKSWTTGQKILLRILSEENHKFLIVRKVATTLRVSVFQLFKDLISNLGLLDDFRINKTEMTITYIPSNSVLLFFGMDNVERLKSIQGITSIWMEECSEMEENDLAELNRRLRGETRYYKQIIITFNPISHLHWLKARLFDNPESKASIYKTTYLDNSFIDEEYKQEIEDIRHYDEQQYRIYALGDWGVLNQNIIHHKYRHLEHLSTKTTNDFNILHIGIDFNIGGCVGVVIGEDTDGVAHCVSEFCMYDTEAIIEYLKTTYSHKHLILYPDVSGDNRSTRTIDTDISMLRGAGWLCIVPTTNGATSTRYNACNRKFKSGSLLINPLTAKKTSESLQTHAYNDKGMPEKFTNHEGGAIDDYTDSFGYVIVRLYPIEAGTYIAVASRS